MKQFSPFYQNCIAPTQNGLCGLAETTDGDLGDLVPVLDQGITELLDGLRCNLVALDGPNQGPVEVSVPSSSRICWHTWGRAG